jgi:hypothetical protein
MGEKFGLSSNLNLCCLKYWLFSLSIIVLEATGSVHLK